MKFLMIALGGAVCMATPAFAGGQDQLLLRDVLLTAAQTPAAAPRPPAAPAAPVSAQPAPVPAPPPIPAVPGVASRPTANVRFDVTITDTGGPKPVTKTLSLTVTPFNSGASIRSSARTTAENVNQVPGGPTVIVPATTVSLNVDVRNVSWVETNAVRAGITVEYQPYVPDAKVQPGLVTASATSAFFDGRKIQILSTADPISDRKTTIEVTATILK